MKDLKVITHNPEIRAGTTPYQGPSRIIVNLSTIDARIFELGEVIGDAML